MKHIRVNSGQLAFVYRQSAMMYTVVGVCVTVCIWDRKLKNGGMCHFRLPIAPVSSLSTENANDYGSVAIFHLLKKFKHADSQPKNLCAWVIGGGDISGGDYIQTQNIGSRNVAITFEMLAQFGVSIVGVSFGGQIGRQIRFNSFLGHVDYKSVNRIDSEYISTPNKIKKPLKLIFIISQHKAMRKWVIAHVNYLHHNAQIHQFENSSALNNSQKPDLILIDNSGFHLDESVVPVFGSTAIPSIMLTDVGALSSRQYIQLKTLFGPHVFISSIARFCNVLPAALQIDTHHINKKLPNGTLHQAIDSAASKLPLLKTDNELILIGSSTGGIDALEVILRKTPKITPPICIVQHVPPTYSRSLIAHLNHCCRVLVKEACHGELLQSSHVYLAPGDKQFSLKQIKGNGIIINLSDDDPVNGFRPSVDYLFHSALKIVGKKKVGVLLTGMGKDGAHGLLKLKEQGAFTLIQNEQSSVVYGMARAAKECGAVCKIVPITALCDAIFEALKQKQPIFNHAAVPSFSRANTSNKSPLSANFSLAQAFISGDRKRQ